LIASGKHAVIKPLLKTLAWSWISVKKCCDNSNGLLESLRRALFYHARKLFSTDHIEADSQAMALVSRPGPEEPSRSVVQESHGYRNSSYIHSIDQTACQDFPSPSTSTEETGDLLLTANGIHGSCGSHNISSNFESSDSLSITFPRADDDLFLITLAAEAPATCVYLEDDRRASDHHPEISWVTEKTPSLIAGENLSSDDSDIIRTDGTDFYSEISEVFQPGGECRVHSHSYKNILPREFGPNLDPAVYNTPPTCADSNVDTEPVHQITKDGYTPLRRIIGCLRLCTIVV
jgi:hypothetical protein